MPLFRRLAGLLLAPLLLAAGSVHAGERHFLWEVAGADNTVYLLGSIHALRPKDYPLAGPVKQAFRESEAVVLEVRIPQGGGEGQAALMSGGEGAGLAAQLSDAQYRRARELARKQGIDLASLSDLDPWLAAIVITQGAFARAGFLATMGLDLHFQQRADAVGKPVLTLETLQQQYRLFDDLTGEVQGDFLVQTLEEAARIDAKMTVLVQAWKAGDADEVRRLVREEFRGYPELRDRLLVRRNRQWLPRIEDFLDDERDYLVVVGAAHMVGEQGLVALLRDRGYAVTQR